MVEVRGCEHSCSIWWPPIPRTDEHTTATKGLCVRRRDTPAADGCASVWVEHRHTGWRSRAIAIALQKLFG